MEPVTHILTGACLSRTGLNRRAAYTTLAMAVGAEFPDVDTLWSLRGPVSSFEHHRGITHTFLGLPFEAAFIVGAIYLFHRWRLRHEEIVAKKTETGSTTSPRSRIPARPKVSLSPAPTNWLLLYTFTLLALLSHLFLDFTNNYGIRPFFPFDPHWYAASIVFIFDPLLFAILLFALILPPLFRLIGSEVGDRRRPFAARSFSAVALLLVVGYWTFREVQHNHAVGLARAQTYTETLPSAPAASATGSEASVDSSAPDASTPPSDPGTVYLRALRVLASPDPLNPFRWYTVTDFGSLYQLGVASTSRQTFVPAETVQPKLNATPVLTAAESSSLGRVYLDWSSMPFLTVTPTNEMGLDDDGNRAARGHTIVTFADPRFMGDTRLLHTSGRTPLTGKVELDGNNHVVAEQIDGKPQRLIP